MKARIVTGVIGSLFALVVFFSPPIVLNFGMALVSGIAMYEVLIVTKYVNHYGLATTVMLFAIIAPFLFLFGHEMVAIMAFLLYGFSMVMIQIIYHETLQIEQTGLVFFISILVCGSVSCVAYLRPMSGRGDPRDGLFYVFLVFIMAWLCDVGAYFIGTFFGKHKLCPKISPKKTVEGLIGGFVASVGCSVLAAFLYQLCLDYMGVSARVSLWQVALLAIVCAPLSVVGDLLASIIKRQCQVKDFGHIMPGHGGVMDRFDSLMFVAPLTLIVVQFFPLVY